MNKRQLLYVWFLRGYVLLYSIGAFVYSLFVSLSEHSLSRIVTYFLNDLVFVFFTPRLAIQHMFVFAFWCIMMYSVKDKKGTGADVKG